MIYILKGLPRVIYMRYGNSIEKYVMSALSTQIYKWVFIVGIDERGGLNKPMIAN